VQAAYCEAVGTFPHSTVKPIRKKVKYYVDVLAVFKHQSHSDPDNIAKAINDALFEADKYVAGSYDFTYDADDPRVEVVIRAANV